LLEGFLKVVVEAERKVERRDGWLRRGSMAGLWKLAPSQISACRQRLPSLRALPPARKFAQQTCPRQVRAGTSPPRRMQCESRTGRPLRGLRGRSGCALTCKRGPTVLYTRGGKEEDAAATSGGVAGEGRSEGWAAMQYNMGMKGYDTIDEMEWLVQQRGR
jgi:hypothetical protein